MFAVLFKFFMFDDSWHTKIIYDSDETIFQYLFFLKAKNKYGGSTYREIRKIKHK